jgi:hypothetical protein
VGFTFTLIPKWGCDTIGQTLVKNLKELLDFYGLSKKIIAYVKNGGTNLNFMTTSLKFVVNCEVLRLEESFNGSYFGHASSKTCQYFTIEKRVCKDLKYVSIKYVRFNI